jgi:hypothetical protein
MYIYYAPGCRHVTLDRAAYLAFLKSQKVHTQAIQSLVIRVKPDLSAREYASLNKERRARYGADYRCPPVAGLIESVVDGVKRPRITLCLKQSSNLNETLLHETGHLVEWYAPKDASTEAKERDWQLTQQYEQKRSISPNHAYWYLPTEVKARAFAKDHATHILITVDRRARSTPVPQPAPPLPSNKEVDIPPAVVIGYLALKLAYRGIRWVLSQSA